ncbi:hypothetical protein [Microlunatus flavus]|uniref:DUF3558 domain-containing protein n=1 Tax=Microlunatus flavus TaxID=1036181 RepID=A0A1H9NJJ8_9ACTN|nr:hypothetical protein [Microlunatus flavus]SER36071.1 hypothetical protein SAMN05421756_11533 [Microlunatus flavus]
MKIPLSAAGLLVAGLVLAGCGSGDASSAPSAAAPSAGAPTSSAAAPASSAPAQSPSSADPSPSASTGGAQVAQVCDTLDADQVKKLTGVAVKKGTSTDLGASNICQWTPAEADGPIFSGQEGPLPGPLSEVEGELKKQFNGKVSTISVSGAADARYITGKKSGVNVIDVLAQNNGVFYQVLVAASSDVSEHKDGAVKLVEALIAA